MDFNINSIAESCLPHQGDGQIDVRVYLGRQYEFFNGVSQRILLPDQLEDYAVLEGKERALTALDTWSRVYRYPNGAVNHFDIVGAGVLEEKIGFDVISFDQKLAQPGRRLPVTFSGGDTFDHETCRQWLIDKAASRFSTRDPRNLVLQRPPVLKFTQPRVLWLGSKVVGNVDIGRTIAAIGRVCGAEVLHLTPRSFDGTLDDIEHILPLDAVYLSEPVARKFGPHVVPPAVQSSCIFSGDATVANAVIDETRVIIELAVEVFQNKTRQSLTEDDKLLGAMFGAMLAHSKIGQNSHCQRETVLKVIRARGLNTIRAEYLITENCEQYFDTTKSDKFFLWKPHNDGDQYFLNPRRVPDCRNLVQACR